MAKVSVLIPVYNAELFLAKTIDSVIAQSFEDWELIILDDCSKDNSYQIALDYSQKHSKIKALKNETNLGMMLNWNKGIDLCHSKYFVKLDADDLWHPTMLEKAINVLEKYSEVGLVFSRYININEQGYEMIGTDTPLPVFAANKSFSCLPLVLEGPDKMLSYPILRQGLSVMRREIFEKIGKYRYLLTKQTQASTDVDFYFRLGSHYKIYCINEILYKYRVHSKSISKLDENNSLDALKLFEIKTAIINYYSDHNMLSKSIASSYIKKVRFDYNLHLTAVYRKNGYYFKMLVVFFINFISNPFKQISFYYRRINKNSSIEKRDN